jgi:hypothetical protein
MPSTVDICNLALMHIGVNATIASLTEQSTEARACSRVYDTAKNATLRDHNWNFATKYISLADIGTPPEGWHYRYQYPNDCIKAISVTPATNNITAQKQHSFRVVSQDNLETKAIICNISPATLEYVADIKSSQNFDPLFVEAISLRIASMIAFTLTGKTRLRNDALKLYEDTIANARFIDAQEGQSQDITEPEWISYRN